MQQERNAARELLVYRRRNEEEREHAFELAAARGLEQLGDGLVYTSVMALPAPTTPARPGMPSMHELPRRVDGMHPRIAAEQAMQQGLFNLSTEYVLPKQVPARLVPEIKAASALCKIKKGISYCIKKIRNVKKKEEKVEDLY